MSEKLNENRLMKSIISALIKGKGKQAAAIASKVNPGIGKKVLSLVKDLADLKKDIDDIKKRKPKGRYDHLGI
jgi:hypothetical protein